MRTTLAALILAGCPASAPTTKTTPEDTETPPPTDTEPPTTPVTDTETDPPIDTAETAVTGDTGPTTPPPACDTVNSGLDWAWRGSCPGMLTPCEILVTGCQLAISYSSGMTMGMPTAGLVTGSSVQFDNNGVPGCVGTVIDPDNIEGTCQGGGCAFTLSR